MLSGFEFGIDLGTCNTLIYQKGKGIVLRQPSVVAVHTETGSIAAYGEQAYAMIGRTPRNIEVVYPLKNGVVASYDLTAAMLQHFVRQALGGRRWFSRPQVVISVPSGVTNVNKRAVEETVIFKGAQKAITIEEPVAAAIGAGLPFYDPVGSMLVDIGGGTMQVAILSLGGIVVSRTIPRGGMSIDRDIAEYVKKTYNLAIGERTAELVKIKLGTAVPPEQDERIEVRGNDLVSGLPRTVEVGAREIYVLLNDFIATLLDAIRVTLETCPPELAGDVMEYGIMLCGGGSLLRGLDRRLQAETGIPFHLAENPFDCVALGAGQMLYNKEKPAVLLRERFRLGGAPAKRDILRERDEPNGQMEALHEKPVAKA